MHNPYRVIIPAAGQGKRMGAGKNKLLLPLKGIPVLVHTLQVFENDPSCGGIYLAINPLDEAGLTDLMKEHRLTKVAGLIHGGKERQQSVYNAVKQLSGEGVVLVHDGARPFLDRDQIGALVAAAENGASAILAVPVKDTVKKARDGIVTETIERSSLWAVQTPQAFRLPLLREAHRRAEEDAFIGTDDASLVERLQADVTIVEGHYDNIKLTTPEDLYFAEAIIKKRKNQL
ncbi:2-C-methyl-D-erythritol 4-phosphate cytidylyltransferase [Cytobacillus purgationiresistens]|uniref:2-C-methyl-D-erythritol 4-phosphate cytidylyltransferase n=1 Tax=Cytobacillus purgationiresistens TaxID=863449 RepID=A0ABU0AND4_9BACI|nr:2-C-methyl-D-erythritol 4-phosphate cytidylyltransferase [Cytobacillus purgationiresistens]MDQ0272550.1 2-C-methyl-D-erythritol 4-phosphate cytidylyltransferase [Cytobacillus purgationiresistens]